jgi:hypothetical protein
MKKFFILFLFFNLITFISNAQTGCDPVSITNVEHEGDGNGNKKTPFQILKGWLAKRGSLYYF